MVRLTWGALFPKQEQSFTLYAIGEEGLLRLVSGLEGYVAEKVTLGERKDEYIDIFFCPKVQKKELVGFFGFQRDADKDGVVYEGFSFHKNNKKYASDRWPAPKNLKQKVALIKKALKPYKKKIVVLVENDDLSFF